MSVALAVSVLVVGRVFGALPEPEGALSAAYASVEALTASAFELQGRRRCRPIHIIGV